MIFNTTLKPLAVAVGLVLCTLPLAGCTALRGPAYIEDGAGGPQKANHFPGLLPAADDPHSKRRYIFQIHGIQALTDAWAEELFKGIVAQGYIRTDGKPVDALLKDPMVVSGRGLNCASRRIDPVAPCVFNRFGVYWKTVFTNPDTSDQVIVFSYRWRDDLWRITGQYVGPDRTANTLPSWLLTTRKSQINAGLKATLLDNGISDAAGYLSPMHDLAREGIETALCAMYADALGSPGAAAQPPHGKGCLNLLANAGPSTNPNAVEFNFLSHSLGSRMLYDVLSTDTAPPPDDGQSARALLAQRTRTFFMAANQLPLLAPVGINISPAVETEADVAAAPGRRGFFSARPKAGAELPVEAGAVITLPLTIIAFQDPDDLLGYKASDAVVADPQDNVSFVDVVHRNTAQILFVLARPDLAHDHELIEPHSLKMILCGASAGEGGRLKAHDCRKIKASGAAG